MDQFSYLSNAHNAAIDDLYQQYKANPSSVDESWQKFFQGFELALQYGEGGSQSASAKSAGTSVNEKEVAVRNLIYAYRNRGHLESKTNPVRERRNWHAKLDLAAHGLSDADLDTTFEVAKEIGMPPSTLRQIVAQLQKVYVGAIGFEYMYIRDPKIQEWLRSKIESRFTTYSLSSDSKKRILKKLNEAVVFENFLHTKYIGQKRFSLEGGETTIPALDSIVNTGAKLGA